MEDTNDLIALRRQKLDTLRSKGVEPFGGRFDTTGTVGYGTMYFPTGVSMSYNYYRTLLVTSNSAAVTADLSASSATVKAMHDMGFSVPNW